MEKPRARWGVKIGRSSVMAKEEEFG